MINCNIGIVEIRYDSWVLIYPKIYLSYKVGYAHCKGLYGLFFMSQIIGIHNVMYYSNNCQLFCTLEQSAGSKRAVCQVYVCESFILKPVNNDGYDAVGGEIEIYVRIMDSVHY